MSKSSLFARVCALAFVGASLAGQSLSAPAIEARPPATRSEEIKDAYGATTVADPYRWLEDQKSPETRAWIDEQNKYSESFLRAFPRRDAIKKRITELLKIETIGVPQ